MRVRGMPGVPVASGPGPRRAVTFPESGLGSALLPAAWSRRRSGSAWADTQTDPRSAGLLAPRAHWWGCVCSAASNFSRIPLVSPKRANWHLGAGGEGSEGRESRGELGVCVGGGRVGPEPGGQSRWGERLPWRRAKQGQRIRSAAIQAPGTPQPWAREACLETEP